MAKKGSSVHMRKAPHPMLLALVAQFLENNGFNSAHRIYNTERRKRPKKEGWEGTFGRSYTAKFPPLETIFSTWKQNHFEEGSDSEENDANDSSSGAPAAPVPDNHITKNEDFILGAKNATVEISSSSNVKDASFKQRMTPKSASSAALSEVQIKSLKRKAPDITSESSSSDSETSGSENESKLEGTNQLAKKPKLEASSPSSQSNSGSISDTTTDSDSESDSDEASTSEKLQEEGPSQISSDSDSESSESDSDSDSDLSQTAPISKKAAAPKSISSDSDHSPSDDDAASDSSATDDEGTKIKIPPPFDKASSDSSATITGDVNSNEQSLSSDMAAPKFLPQDISIPKKRHLGAQATRLAQLSENADLKDYVSNNYVSYDYADKAFHDLSVTRGKGFTKEKNKKKRGSYRGGFIDTSGGKGFKFEE